MSRKIRTYSELVLLPTFEERYRYLKLGGKVGEDTFGFDRYLNQVFYRSSAWRKIRNEVITRDYGRDLAMDGYMIPGRVYVHHMNPLTAKDIEERADELLNPEFLISVSFNTHNAIHYADDSLIIKEVPIARTPHDTCPWKSK